MSGKPFVQERVIGAQQIERAAILAHDALEEQFRFAPKGLPKSIVKVRKVLLDRNDGRKVTQEQPLSCELLHKRAEPWICDHPADLPIQYRRILQPILLGQAQQFLVRNTTPEEERQSRRNVEIADTIRSIRWNVGRICLNTKQELRTHQQSSQSALDSAIEAVLLFTAFAIKREERLEIRIGDGPPIRTARECAKNFSGARQILIAADKNLPAAW